MWKWLKETILAIVVVVLTTAGAAAAAPSLSDGAHLLTPAEQAEVTAVRGGGAGQQFGQCAVHGLV